MAAYVQGGDIWLKRLPEAQPQRVTDDNVTSVLPALIGTCYVCCHTISGGMNLLRRGALH
jgi:hypothetical protein